MKIDNAIIKYFPLSPYIAKADVKIRCGNKTVFQTALSDADAATAYIENHFPGIPVRVITQM